MQTIYIDISNKGVISTVYAKQGDVGRKFAVIFTNSGIPYSVENALFSAWYDGDSGEGNYTDIGDTPAFTSSGNKVEVEMIAQMLSVAGGGVLCLVLENGDQQIGSWNIPYICEEVPGFDSEGATEYYTAFSEVIDAAQKFTIDKTLSVSGRPADAAETGRQISVVRARLNHIIALPEGSTTADAELMDIRVGVDGITYESAGEAVRSQIEMVHSDVLDVKEEIITAREGAYGEQYSSLAEAIQIPHIRMTESIESLSETIKPLDESSSITQTASGDVITLNDSANRKLQGLKLYGKTTQNGTPTPEAPVALESAGEDGSVTVKVLGKNLFNKDAASIGYIDDADGVYYDLNTNFFASDWMVVGGEYLTITTTQEEGMWGAFYDANKNYIEGIKGYKEKPTKKIPANAKYIRLTTKPDALDFFQVELGATATAFEPYKEPQTLTLPTPNGLSGIPVASGGNYTDADGQQWVCDEVDFTKGVYVKRIKTVVLDGSNDEVWSLNNSASAKFIFTLSDIADCTSKDIQLLCDKYLPIGINETWSNYDYLVSRFAPSDKHLFFRDINFSALDEWKAHLAANPITVQYVLAEPIVTPLTAEQLEAYEEANLHTYKPNTTITNDGGAIVEMEYVADTKAYIDNKFAELANAIVNNA